MNSNDVFGSCIFHFLVFHIYFPLLLLFQAEFSMSGTQKLNLNSSPMPTTLLPLRSLATLSQVSICEPISVVKVMWNFDQFWVNQGIQAENQELSQSHSNTWSTAHGDNFEKENESRFSWQM